MDDDDVSNIYSDEDNYAFPFPLECERCNKEWNDHNGLDCPNGSGDTFIPPADWELSDWSGPELEGEEIKCIHSDENAVLRVGQTYKVSKEFRYCYELVGYTHDFDRDCFEPVKKHAILPNVSHSIDDDPEEERLRNLLKPYQGPNDCPCGIERTQCSYHRS